MEKPIGNTARRDAPHQSQLSLRGQLLLLLPQHACRPASITPSDEADAAQPEHLSKCCTTAAAAVAVAGPRTWRARHTCNLLSEPWRVGVGEARRCQQQPVEVVVRKARLVHCMSQQGRTSTHTQAAAHAHATQAVRGTFAAAPQARCGCRILLLRLLLLPSAAGDAAIGCWVAPRPNATHSMLGSWLTEVPALSCCRGT